MKTKLLFSMKFSKLSIIILGFLFLFFYIISYNYPLVYDDVTFSQSTINEIGWRVLRLDALYGVIKSMYNYSGRIGYGFIYIMIHLPYIQAIGILLLYGFFPYMICGNFSKNSHFSLGKFLTFFSIITLLSLLAPWHFYIFNDFFNRTMSMTYIFSMIGFIGVTVFTWYQMMLLKYININILGCIILVSSGFFISIHNELITLYGIAISIGILMLASIRYKKIPVFSNSIIFLYSGILCGSLIVFTSKGFVSNILNTGSYSRSNNSVLLIKNEILPISLLLLIAIGIIYILYYFLSKKKKSLLLETEKKEFFYRSLYLFLVWCGFIIILYIARLPYFRTLIIGATILPLVYLLILVISRILDIVVVPNFFILVPSVIIIYSLHILVYNVDLMNKIINDFQKQITIAKDTNTDLIVPTL